MAREIISEVNAENVVGGTIVFNAAHTTCGHNCNDQYQVNDYDAVMSFIAENRFSMTERKMLAACVDAGYLSPL